MLALIQIIAILQGAFLGFTLFQKRKEFKSPIFWLFMGCILSIVLFSIGDDDYNLLVKESSWQFFHEPLMVTFFFLFTKYIVSEQDKFSKLDGLYFLPYVLNLVFETLSHFDFAENSILLEIFAEVIEFSFVGMLLYSIYNIYSNKKGRWLLVFLIPFTVIYLLEELLFIIMEDESYFGFLDSYGIFLLSVFLFYYATYQLVIDFKGILPAVDQKYKLSNLSKSEVEKISSELNRLMIEEKIFRNQKLNANDLATKIGISRQQLSEVLNVHVGMRFQDYLNHHRVEEFIKCLDQEEYKNFTLLGIATEVGFSSKSSFNSTFKKLKGVTPSAYKKAKI